METFLQGSIGTAFAVAGIFFLRYWKETRDRLFLLFALAFFTLALNRGLLAAVAESREDHYGLYLIRLAAFLIILAAIVDKNLRRSPKPDEEPARRPGKHTT